MPIRYMEELEEILKEVKKIKKMLKEQNEKMGEVLEKNKENYCLDCVWRSDDD